MRILLLYGSSEDDKKVLEKLRSSISIEVFICPLSYGANAAAPSLRKKLLNAGAASCQIIVFPLSLEESLPEAKKLYQNFIRGCADLKVRGRESLKEYFADSEQKFSYWWLSQVYEQSPGKSDAFLHFARTLTVLKLYRKQGCEEIWVGNGLQRDPLVRLLCQSSLRAKVLLLKGHVRHDRSSDVWIVLRECVRALKLIGDLLFRWMSIRRSLGDVKPSSPESAPRNYFVTMFPFLDEDVLDEGRFVSRPYETLQQAFDKEGPPYGWIAMHNRIGSYAWSDSLRFARRIKAINNDFHFLDQGLDGAFFLRLMTTYVAFVWKTLRSMPDVRIKLKCSLEEVEVSLWPILAEDYISSFGGKVFVANVAFLDCFRSVLRRLPSNSVVVHFAEMHAWERCLKIAAADRPDIRIVGLQHTIVPVFLLNYFNEYQTQENYVQSAPFPDKLGCVGSTTRNMFRSVGWPEDKLFISGAFRFQALQRFKDSEETRKTIPPLVITAAFSICRNENLELVMLLKEAFNHKDHVRVYLKSHPCEDVRRMCQDQNLQLNENVFFFTETDVEPLLAESYALVAASTSTVFHAMMRKMPVFVPYRYHAIDLGPLAHVFDHIQRFLAAEELQALCENLPHDQRETRKFLDLNKDKLVGEYLHIFEQEQEYFERLKPHLAI